MKYLAVVLFLTWVCGLATMLFGRSRARFYVNRRNGLIAAGLGVLGGLASILADPGETWVQNAGLVASMAFFTMMTFLILGHEHPDRIEEQRYKWTIDLSDKAVERLQIVGLSGIAIGGFVVVPLYELWDDWDTTARAAWIAAAVVVGLMMVIPIVILTTHRRRRPPDEHA